MTDMEDIWSSLKQDEKYEIIRDYVRRGFNNLDAIMDDYNKNAESVGIANQNIRPTRSAMEEVLNEWYSNGDYPDQ